ncbi:hypothetical protein E3C22_20875 [Jiella endophytica]|uniref:Uncharacterized protein n=1 Tax=Jiella endophytica TaxID=2558362 RepID=A0A4Y8RAV6_9HYPH|nr:hypothetical protein [Jiella endophytica]TFF18683.1 hypothetical protein E3C22_20875 [Jiella endophytica]
MSAAFAYAEPAFAGAVILPFQRDGGTFQCPTVAQRVPQLAEEDVVRLNRLRWFALKSRLSPKPDVERACLVLSAQAEARIDDLANIFFRALDEHANRELSLYRPGARRPSEDEIWLLRLLDAWREGDRKAGSALISWRVGPEGRRWLRFLAEAFANHL